MFNLPQWSSRPVRARYLLLSLFMVLGAPRAVAQEIPDAPSTVRQYAIDYAQSHPPTYTRVVTTPETKDSIKPLKDWKFYSANLYHFSGVFADNHNSLSCTSRGTCIETNPIVCSGCLRPTGWQMWRKDALLNIPVVTGVSYAAGWEAEKLRYSRWRFLFRGIEYGYPIVWGTWRWQAAKDNSKY